MASAAEKIAQIRRPPSLPNWVRLNHRRRDETARNIARFVLGKPRYTLAEIYTIAADYVTFRLPFAGVRLALSKIKNPLVAKLGNEILSVLLPWLDQHEIKGISVFHRANYAYPIGRGIIVPVKPTCVFLEDGKLTPVFVIGWASMPFDGFQKQLLATIIHNAVLTQEGFEGSDAYVVCVPRHKGSHSERWVRSWKVSEMPLLTEAQLLAQFDCFGNALDDAVPVILQELARRGEE